MHIIMTCAKKVLNTFNALPSNPAPIAHDGWWCAPIRFATFNFVQLAKLTATVLVQLVMVVLVVVDRLVIKLDCALMPSDPLFSQI